MNEYKYTSLPEFNPVLKLYNIVADRGDKESLMYKNGGLVYRVLDETGNKIGTPIKASEFYNKPTLRNLEKKFSINEELRIPRARHVKLQIDWAITRHPNIRTLIADLSKESIEVLARQNAEGRIYGMTFIDLKNRVVFNGSDLGKEYAANAIIERCGIKPFVLNGLVWSGCDSGLYSKMRKIFVNRLLTCIERSKRRLIRCRKSLVTIISNHLQRIFCLIITYNIHANIGFYQFWQWSRCKWKVIVAYAIVVFFTRVSCDERNRYEQCINIVVLFFHLVESDS